MKILSPAGERERSDAVAMNAPSIPQSYAQWRHCIVVDCGLELTPEYIAERVAALQDPRDYHTAKFIELYGEQHLQRVIGWFAEAGKTV